MAGKPPLKSGDLLKSTSLLNGQQWAAFLNIPPPPPWTGKKKGNEALIWPASKAFGKPHNKRTFAHFNWVNKTWNHLVFIYRAVFTWQSKGIGFGLGFGFTTPFGWLMYLLWFWFYDSQVKTALYSKCEYFSSHDSYEQFSFSKRQINSAVSDPDLEIKGGLVIQTLRQRRGAVSKKFFSALWASVWSKNKGAGPPGPSPQWIRHCSASRAFLSLPQIWGCWERFCINGVRSLLGMRCMLLGHRLERLENWQFD